MYCKKCGAYNSSNSLRCKNCGDFFVNQYNNTEDLERETTQVEDKNNNGNKNKYNNKDNKNNHNDFKRKSRKNREKVKYKKVKSRKRDTIFNINKDKSKNNNDNKKNNYKEKEVIVKTSLFSKFMLFFLSLLVIILIAICSFLGLYILKDKVVMMPDVIGLNIEDAKVILDENGISYSIQEKSTSDDNINIVLEQNPNSGKYILKNKSVKITVGSKKNNNTNDDTDTKDTTSTNNKEIILDNYVGLNMNEVISKLDTLNIKYEIKKTDEDGEKDIVVRQSPSANSIINEDTTVILYVPNIKDDNTSSDID